MSVLHFSCSVGDKTNQLTNLKWSVAPNKNSEILKNCICQSYQQKKKKKKKL